MAATGINPLSENEGSTGGKIPAVQAVHGLQGMKLDMGPTPPLAVRDGDGLEWSGLGNPLFNDN